MTRLSSAKFSNKLTVSRGAKHTRCATSRNGGCYQAPAAAPHALHIRITASTIYPGTWGLRMQVQP